MGYRTTSRCSKATLYLLISSHIKAVITVTHAERSSSETKRQKGQAGASRTTQETRLPAAAPRFLQNLLLLS